MLRRSALQALFTLGLPPAIAPLAGCGGGGGDEPGGPQIRQFSADKSTHLIGERAVLTAVFSGGTGEIMPGSLPVQSGVPMTLPQPLSESVEVALVVRAADGARATRTLQLDVAYRNRLRTLPMGFTRAGHVTATADDGRLLIVSGEFQDPITGNYHISDEVRAFDPVSETFSLAGHLLSPRVGQTATTLPTDQVLVLGSRILSGTPAAELFDPRTGRSSAAGIANQRSHHTVTLLGGGLVLLAGGQTATQVPSAELYDPFTDTTTALAGLQIPRSSHAALRLPDGRVLIFGGIARDPGAVPAPELFDPETRRFTLLAMPEALQRINHALLHNSSGGAFVIGGEDAYGGEPQRSTLRLTGTATAPAPAMNVARTLVRAAPMADGRIWVAGGNSGIGLRCEASTEWLSPDGSAWTPGPALSVGRAYHTVDRLASGKLLVIGGNDSATHVLGTAELYD